MNVLVTVAAGFIGANLSLLFLKEGHTVCSLDNLNDYYDVNLKKARLAPIKEYPGFDFQQLDLADRGKIEALFKANSLSIKQGIQSFVDWYRGYYA